MSPIVFWASVADPDAAASPRPVSIGDISSVAVVPANELQFLSGVLDPHRGLRTAWLTKPIKQGCLTVVATGTVRSRLVVDGSLVAGSAAGPRLALPLATGALIWGGRLPAEALFADLSSDDVKGGGAEACRWLSSLLSDCRCCPATWLELRQTPLAALAAVALRRNLPALAILDGARDRVWISRELGARPPVEVATGRQIVCEKCRAMAQAISGSPGCLSPSDATALSATARSRPERNEAASQMQRVQAAGAGLRRLVAEIEQELDEPGRSTLQGRASDGLRPLSEWRREVSRSRARCARAIGDAEARILSWLALYLDTATSECADAESPSK